MNRNGMMRVIQLLDRFQLGGAEQVALTYADVFSKLDVDNEIYAIDSGVKNRLVVLFVGYWGYLTSVYKSVFSSNDRVVLVSHTIRSLIASLLFKLIFPFRVRLVFVQHLFYSEKKLRLLSLISPLIFKVIEITPIISKLLNRFWGGDKVFNINNFLTSTAVTESPISDEVLTLASGRKVILFVGAMRKHGKNAHHVFDLARELSSDEYFFCIVGDGGGAELDRFKAAMASYQGDNYVWLGYRGDVPAILPAADILFFPSYPVEMMPMTVLEAMRSNLTVVSYDIEVCKALLPESNVFSYGDFNALATAIVAEHVVRVSCDYDEDYGLSRWRELLRQVV